MATIEDVREFWESRPLWSGEAIHEPGTAEYFEEHRRTVVEDCFAGELDPRIFPASTGLRILDLGCGPGFWLVEFGGRGFRQLSGADLTEAALGLAGRRLEIYGFRAALARENAECLTFPDGSFDHVNCQGVIHHTPDTEACIREIARVLVPGGTASISVYYRNLLLRMWPFLSPVGRLMHRLGGGLKGRGREHIYAVRDANEIVRTYDGAENPVGKSYTRRQFVALLEPHFVVEETFLHFFPARTLPFALPRAVHRWMDRRTGFLIYASVRRR